MMKLSEAILLGSTVTAEPLSNESWTTCLLGMGCAAFSADNPFNGEALRRWPWLNDQTTFFTWEGEKTTLTCTGSELITGLCTGVLEGLITLDRAVEIIGSVEPQEEQTDGGQGPVETSLEEMQCRQ